MTANTSLSKSCIFLFYRIGVLVKENVPLKVNTKFAVQEFAGGAGKICTGCSTKTGQPIATP